MEQFDRKKDGPVNNYVGSKSLSGNVRKVPKEMLACVLRREFTKEAIFKGGRNVKIQCRKNIGTAFTICCMMTDNVKKIAI